MIFWKHKSERFATYHATLKSFVVKDEDVWKYNGIQWWQVKWILWDMMRWVQVYQQPVDECQWYSSRNWWLDQWLNLSKVGGRNFCTSWDIDNCWTWLMYRKFEPVLNPCAFSLSLYIYIWYIHISIFTISNLFILFGFLFTNPPKKDLSTKLGFLWRCTAFLALVIWAVAASTWVRPPNRWFKALLR